MSTSQPTIPSTYTTRTHPLEICALAIIPSHPNFMVLGTYALLSPTETTSTTHPPQLRKGTLTILPVLPTFAPTYPGMLPPSLSTTDLPAAILDLHFHPQDGNLLCVATSAGTLHFYRLNKHASILHRRVEMSLLLLGSAKIAEDDEHGLTHLITSFTWLAEITSQEGSGYQIVSLAATESSGRVQLVKLSIPNSPNKNSEIRDEQPPKIPLTQLYLHTHTEEAWIVATLALPSPQGMHSRFLLSGGDDSALRTSLLSLNVTDTKMDLNVNMNIDMDMEILVSPSIPCWSDTKMHNGGVTAILPLSLTFIDTDSSNPNQQEGIIPLLTGSYDDNLRLYTLHPTSLKRDLILATNLGGGVWRLKLMDRYALGGNEQHWIILASCMHAGVRILRLVYTPSSSATSTATCPTLLEPWTLTPIASFTAGHSSMVYACDFRHEDGRSKSGKYTIVSTSFYDMKICTWDFVDELKPTSLKAQRDS